MWTQELAQSYSSVPELSRAGLITSEEARRLESLGSRFKVRITPYYAALMSPARDCPIRSQAIPALGEDDPELPAWAREWSLRLFGRPEPWTADAIGDLDRLAAPRLTHRYGNRAILHLSSLCAVYCRFCFRKSHLNEKEALLYDGSLDPAFEYLSAHPEIRELILTGGDPLSLTEPALERVLDRAARLPSLRVLRIHSRMAVTLPSRLTPELAGLLSRPRRDGARELSVHLVSHFNHPREWTTAAREGLSRLRLAGIPLFNQSVLLRGINDSEDTLAELFQGLYEAGITPMYLHHPDWTPGTFHFRPSIKRGRELARRLRGRLPGAAIPHYVLELPRGLGKTPLLETSLRKLDEWNQGSVHGAVYELEAPLTRSGRGTVRYLDLFHAG
jgi:lysine 2,3-aminomutase